MKILCQERYEKAVAYAKEIKNDTLQKCIDRLKQWEQNPERSIPMAERVLLEACSITAIPINLLPY